MPTPKIAIRLPRQLISDMRGLAHRESLRRGHTVSWVRLLTETAERYVRNYGEGDGAEAGQPVAARG
jgi:hypothetical protein